MPRVKRGMIKNKRRKNILSMTKGFRHGRSSKLRQAREAIFKIAKYTFAHRKDKKANFRQEWHLIIGGALKEHNVSFSRFIGALHKKNIGVNKKMLATLAEENPPVFNKIVEATK